MQQTDHMMSIKMAQNIWGLQRGLRGGSGGVAYGMGGRVGMDEAHLGSPTLHLTPIPTTYVYTPLPPGVPQVAHPGVGVHFVLAAVSSLSFF